MKTANIDRETIYTFWTFWEFQWNFQETYDNIKSHKNQDFTSLQKIYFLKYTGRGQIHHPSCFRVNAPLASDNPSRFRKNILVRI